MLSPLSVNFPEYTDQGTWQVSERACMPELSRTLLRLGFLSKMYDLEAKRRLRELVGSHMQRAVVLCGLCPETRIAEFRRQ